MKAMFLLMLASGTALADDSAIRQCRTLTDTAGRLACYDAIPLAPVTAATPQATTAAAAAPQAAAAAPVRTPEQDFGIDAKKTRPEPPKSITSTIAGRFDGWQPGQVIRLANGQAWRVTDGSQAVLDPVRNPKVTIERNLVGTMFLKIEGTNQSPKVRRVQE